MTTERAQADIGDSDWKNFKYDATVLPPDSPSATPTPPVQGCLAMLHKVNALRPFSHATSILDIACGPGTLYSTLFTHSSALPLSPSAALLAVDVSTPMISAIHARQAVRRPSDVGTWARIAAWEGDARDLAAVPDGSQSHVLSQMGLFLVPETRRALREARRVMKRDGTGVFSMSAVGWTAWFDDITVPGIEGVRGDLRVPRTAEKWRSVELFRGELVEAGFEGVEVEEMDMHLVSESAERLVQSLWDMLPFIPSLAARMSDDEVRLIKAAMAEKTARLYPGNRYPGKLLLATGF